jgi:hypothetical protein
MADASEAGPVTPAPEEGLERAADYRKPTSPTRTR